MLLFTARSSHIRHVIQPALAAGKVVISDRFSDSTYAYQGYGHGLPLDVIKQIEEISVGNFKPDLTIILDIPVTEGLARSKARLKNESSAEDRFERIDFNFHERLRQYFIEIALDQSSRCFLFDASKTEAELANGILSLVLKRISG